LCVESLEAREVLNAQFGIDPALLPSAGSKTAATGADWSQISDDLAYVHHELGLTGGGQTVAVIDSGIAYDHAALGGGFGEGYRVVGGWDFSEADADPFDDAPAGFHGTHVAGIIGGDDTQYTGVAPDVHLVALRVFNDQGASDFAWVEEALQWVHDNRNAFEFPITTVNLSLGADATGRKAELEFVLKDELAQLHRDGIFVAVAAGNHFHRSASQILDYPASDVSVVPVASFNSDGKISHFSQRDQGVLVAPGEQIRSTAPDFIEDFNGITDDYLTISGTSSAAPYVAGASVLVRQALHSVGRQSVNQDQIERILRRSALQVYDPVSRATYAHIDLRATLDAVLQPAIRDLGTVEQHLLRGLVAEPNGSQHKLTAARDGFLTIQVSPAMGLAPISLAVYDRHGARLGGDHGTGQPLRVDLPVTEGQVVQFELTGERVFVDVHLANLVSWQGAQLDVFGTSEGDVIHLDVSREAHLSVNGVEYDLTTGGPASVRIHAASGSDTLYLTGGADSEEVVMMPRYLRLDGNQFVVETWGFERQFVVGGGGHDQAVLTDSSGRDFFRGRPGYGLMFGRGFRNSVKGFAAVRATSDSGGGDRARLIGSAGNDTLYGFSRDSLLMGDGFSIHAQGFKIVHASANQGGHDAAYLFASRKDALVRGDRHRRSVLIKTDAVHLAFGFAEIQWVDSANPHASAARLAIDRLDPNAVDEVFHRAYAADSTSVD
jgi:hypothetical protein